MLLNEWNNKRINEKIKRYLDINENENIMMQNSWAIAKPVLIGKFIAIQTYLKKLRKISNKPFFSYTYKSIYRRNSTQHEQNKRNNKQGWNLMI